MRALLIVMPQIAPQTDTSVARRPIFSQIHLFVLYTPPEPLDKDVVQRAAASIHTDLDARRLQQARVLRTGEMAALVAIPDLRRRHRQCTTDRIQNKRLL